MRKYLLIILVFLVLVSSTVACTKKYEVNNDVEVLKYYLEDLPIKKCAWYNEAKKDRFTDIGPYTYIFYGIAELDEDYCIEIYEDYEWEPAKKDDHIFNKLSELNIEKLNLDVDNYYVSESFNDENNSNIALEVLFDSKNNIMLFYREFQDF